MFYLAFPAFTQDFQEKENEYIEKNNSFTGWPLCDGETRSCETPTSDKNFKMADNEEKELQWKDLWLVCAWK